MFLAGGLHLQVPECMLMKPLATDGMVLENLHQEIGSSLLQLSPVTCSSQNKKYSEEARSWEPTKLQNSTDGLIVQSLGGWRVLPHLIIPSLMVSASWGWNIHQNQATSTFYAWKIQGSSKPWIWPLF
uniref:Uncharacterized protein n=1 Tax=Macaca fascicularis TaxID=9541 RepID=Q9BE50_MACFA|nr:hypothetical protein [Macaca fascicularis]